MLLVYVLAKREVFCLIMRFLKQINRIFVEATELFEKHEKRSVSEHFTSYLSVASFHAKVLYIKDSQ